MDSVYYDRKLGRWIDPLEPQMNDHVEALVEQALHEKFPVPSTAPALAKAVTIARGSTHGDFIENPRVAQRMKEVMRTAANWPRLDDTKREALDMIVHKIARVLAGDPGHPDHWLDIEGYARITRERL